MDRNTQQFILENVDADVRKLALTASKFPTVNMQLAIRQIEGRQKIKSKVPTFYDTTSLLYPAKLSIEQCSSEATATYKSSLCNGKQLVDLTGGFGVDCFFMSKSFENVRYVERNAELCEIASENFNALGSHHIEVINNDSVAFLSVMQCADWIFIDPARRSASGKKVVSLSDCEPDITQLYPLLITKASNIMVKLSPMMDISVVLNQLPTVSELHIISVDNECKELILILKNIPTTEYLIKTINIRKNHTPEVFEFELNEEEKAESIFTTEIAKYLYEPNTSVMKSGAFKLIGSKFNLKKLHKSTHLYTSDALVQSFPGKIFEVNAVYENSRSSMKVITDNFKKANVISRNYPLTADELKSKLKLKDGGELFLIACTSSDNKKLIAICNRYNP